MNVFSSFPLFFVGCVLTCKRKNWTDLREKAASQCWQRYFLSPVWSLTWRSRDLLCLKSRRQKSQRNGISSLCACQKKTQNPKPISFFCPSRLFPSLITCSCFLRRDRRGKERWQKLQLNGTDRAELAASAALESLLLLAGGGVDKTTWPSVGGILASWRRSVELKSQRRNFELEMHHEGKAIRVCLPSHNNNKSLK